MFEFTVGRTKVSATYGSILTPLTFWTNALLWIPIIAKDLPFSVLGLFVAVVFGTCALLGCLLLHEFAHALMYWSFGCEVSELGFRAYGMFVRKRADKVVLDPVQRMLVILAGPLMNMGIAIALIPGLYIAEPSLLESVVKFIVYANVLLAIFNLLPQFTNDGGLALVELIVYLTGSRKLGEVVNNVCSVFTILLLLMIGFSYFAVQIIRAVP